MSNKSSYKTKQREEMQKFLENTNGDHFTASDVSDYFRKQNIRIGTTTIYRRLEELVSAGIVKKYFIDEVSSACFEYIGDNPNGKLCYHLKCEKCGKLIHLHCDEITSFEQHISGHHDFIIDPAKTVFYGTCAKCQ